MGEPNNLIFHSSKRCNILVVTDADNTLWDTNSVYAEGQLGLLKRIERDTGLRVGTQDRLAFIRTVDQELARLSSYDLKYPPELLVYAIETYLTGGSPQKAASNSINSHMRLAGDKKMGKHAKWFVDHLKSKIPKLRPGVKTGIRKLNQIGIPLIILTEGNQERCQALLDHYNLSNFIVKIIASRKHVSLYKGISNKFGSSLETKVMIGDQLDRDILAAKEAGYITIYFPSGFQPSWITADEGYAADYQISSFKEVPCIVERIGISP
jgi:putative hydrolase of the HAD superfamily